MQPCRSRTPLPQVRPVYAGPTSSQAARAAVPEKWVSCPVATSPSEPTDGFCSNSASSQSVAVELQPVLGAREPRPVTYDRLLYAISL